MTTTTVSPSMGDFVQLFFQFLSKRDLENLTALFAEEVDWYIPGNEELAPWLGKRTSRSQVREFYQLLWQNTEALSASVDKLMIDGDDAIISGTFSSRMLQTGKVVDSLFFIQLTRADGLIVKYQLLEDSYAVFIALKEE